MIFLIVTRMDEWRGLVFREIVGSNPCKPSLLDQMKAQLVIILKDRQIKVANGANPPKIKKIIILRTVRVL